MKRTLLNQCVLLAIVANAMAAQANTLLPPRQCYPSAEVPAGLTALNKDDATLRIESNAAELISNETAEFSGPLQLTYRDTLLTAPMARVSKKEQSMFAEGGISYFSSQLKVSSSSFSARLAENIVTLKDAEYRFISQAGRGYAQEMSASNQEVVLQQASFSTCPQGDNGWTLEAERIAINAEDGWGEAWDSVVKIKGVPVLYLPYMTYPVNDQRKTGVLFPNIGSSQKVGLEFQVPYYLNLAENYDATLTPRYMSQRGTQLKSEFRYLTATQEGRVYLEYLYKDQDKPKDFGQRYLSHFSHKANFAENFRAHIDFTDISDDSYLAELGSDINNQSDTQLYRQATLSYFGDAIHADMRLQGFEILGNYQKAYAALPQIDFRAAAPMPLGGGVEFSWYGQYAHFKNDSRFVQNANRLHLEPTLQLPYYSQALELLAEATLLQTFYQQDFANQNSTHALIEKSVTRSIPKVRLMGKINLERQTSWFGSPSLQTLEPQVQYLYVPYRDQRNIYLFDTARLQDDYHGLFRQNRFSGLDRINDANQVTLGWTSRIYDEEDTERFRFSVGQIIFLADPTAEFESDISEQMPGHFNSGAATESIFAAESLVHWQQRWFLTGAIQYDAETKRMIKSNTSLDYRADNKNIFQLNHRYSRDVSSNEIAQIGALGTMPVAENWQAIASYYRDISNSRTIEANLGLQYESCCWAIRFIASRQIETNLDQTIASMNGSARLDSSIGLKFVLKGFGDSAGFDVSDMLSNGIFGYRRPYLLNN